MSKLSICIGFTLLVACSPDKALPPGVLSIDSMKTIIWDMSLADNMATEKYALNKDSQRIMTTGLYRKVFTLHKIDKAAFYKSYGYYEAHPAELKILFDSIGAYGMRQKALSYQKPQPYNSIPALNEQQSTPSPHLSSGAADTLRSLKNRKPAISSH